MPKHSMLSSKHILVLQIQCLISDINTVDRINGSIQIVDMLGHKIYDEKIDLIGLMSKQINVSTFAKGLYTIQITDANKDLKRSL